MTWLGDFHEGSTVNHKFTTVAAATGAPTTLTGSPAIHVYKADSATEQNAGVTLTTDFDGRTGLNHVRVTLDSDPVYYSGGDDFQIVITSGTVGGTSVVGYVVGSFSVGRGVNLTRWLGVLPFNLAAGRVPAAAEVVSDKSGYRLSAQGITDVTGVPMVESYAAPGVAPTLVQAVYMILQSINDIEIIEGVISVKQRDGAEAFQCDLNSATTPTSRRQAT